MDRSQDDNAKASTNRTNPLPPRLSVDAAHSPRLQKKRSVKRVHAKRLTNKPVDEQPTAVQSLALAEQGPSSDDALRPKSTLRNTVRKIFGRRSRTPEVETQPPAALREPSYQPSKHKAHRSEPPEIANNTELPPRPNTADRATSASLLRDSPTSATRVRSPNAVEFPKSRQLKPLVLPAPFEDPRATLRRRKTLPSILVPEQDAKEIAAAIASAGPYPTESSFDLPLEPPLPPPTGLTAGTIKSVRRRSRSAGDLREQALQAGPVRKRSDEIRFWRESIQTTVLRASGFTMPPEEQEPVVDSAAATSTPPRPSKASSPAARNRLSSRNSPGFDVHSASAYGTDFSKDLEDRVAKLEANLNFFQRSLQKLQTDKSRRVGLAGLRPRNKRDAPYDRTPSMLVDDLQLPLAAAPYNYAFEPGPRPSTAPSRPPRPFRADADVPPVPSLAQPESTPPTLPPPVPPPAPPPAPPLASPQQRVPPPRPSRPDEPSAAPAATPTLSENPTFRSLYRMLTDERSARRQLETQVRDMRTEISDLQYQVTSQSQVQSHRSSYLFSTPSEAGAGSARLRDLLGQLEAPTSQHHATLPRGSAYTEAVVSRFSGSTRQESEAGAAQEEIYEESQEYDSQQTPRPGHGNQPAFESQSMQFPALDGPYAGDQSEDKLESFRRQQEGEMF